MSRNKIDRVYAFARDRAADRVGAAPESGEPSALDREQRALHTIEGMHACSGQDALLLVCAVSYFRARAMRDAHHPEFRGEWLGARSTS